MQVMWMADEEFLDSILNISSIAAVTLSKAENPRELAREYTFNSVLLIKIHLVVSAY